MIGIIGALKEEIEFFESEMKDSIKKTEHIGIQFISGTIGDKDVVVVLSGVGKVNAAMAATALIDFFKPEYVFSTGTAGGINAVKSTTVIASATVQHDFYIELEGKKRGQLDEYDFTEIPCSAQLIKLAEEVSLALEYDFSTGIIATGDCFVSHAEQRNSINEAFHPLACDMESAAIGQVCFKANVPFLSVRTLSDSADDSGVFDYYAFKRQAAFKNSRLITEIIKRI